MSQDFDSSQLQAYKNCPYAYKLTYVNALRKRSDGETEHDREFGGAFHAGLEELMKGNGLEKAQASFKEAYPSQLDETDLAKTQANGLILLQEFEAWFKVNYAGYEVVQVEQVGRVRLDESNLFIVKPDSVIRNKASNEFYGMENKTTGNSLTPLYWSRFDPNAQITAQSALIAQEFGSCSGVFVNAISFGFRKRAYKGEPAGFHFNLERELVNRNSLQMERWKADSLNWIKRIQADRASNGWGKNTEHCRWCSYKPICMAEWTPEEDMELIEEMFEVVDDPYAYLKEGKQ